MDHAVLVDIDVRIGAEVVTVLNESGVDLRVALWATFVDYISPRLVLASDFFDQTDPRLAYGQAGEILHGKISVHRLPTLLILRMTDPFIKDIRQFYAGMADLEGMRLESQSFGGRFLEDGYVYLIK